MILDKNDLTILPTFTRDCRTSYGSIGLQIGLTSKSVKARVKKMVGSGVIEKFVVRVNPTAFGYRTAIMIIRTSNGITKDDIVQLPRNLEILHIMCIMYSPSVIQPEDQLTFDVLARVNSFAGVKVLMRTYLPNCNITTIG